MGRIRAFVQDDIPGAAALYWRFLQRREGPHPPSLEEYFKEVFFHNPWFDNSIPSLVYEDGPARIVGFLGIVPRPMSLNGKTIRAAFGSSLVVHPESRCTLAGLKLLMAFFEGKQDLAMTDTSNRLNQRIWERLGGSASPALGIQWARPLRPGPYALHVLGRLGEEGLSGTVGGACSVLAKTIGAAATKISLRRRRQPDCVTEEELDIDTLLHSCLSDCSAHYSLQPQYNKESLAWLLDLMARMKAYGSLRRVALRDRSNQLIGWFIYYAKPGGVADVVQIGASKRHMKTVLKYLFCDARNHGAIGVHGRLEIRHAQELSEARCFFWGTVPLLFRARDPDLVRVVQQGDAFLSRLNGEWCLKYGAPEHERESAVLGVVRDGKESNPKGPTRLAPPEPSALQPKAVK